jgi:intraflagellar transport protein 46
LISYIFQILVQNNHYDEVLDVSNDVDDTEDAISLDQNGDHSPRKVRLFVSCSTNHLIQKSKYKTTIFVPYLCIKEKNFELNVSNNSHSIEQRSQYDISGKGVINSFYDEKVEIHNDEGDDVDDRSINTNDGMQRVKKEKLSNLQSLTHEQKIDFDDKDGNNSNNVDNDEILNRDEDEETSFESKFFPPEIVDLFTCINNYKPKFIPIEPKLKCFIPPYIPAIGNVDPFLKVPRPDNIADGLGLSVIDEPAAQQSDAAVLELKLKTQMKQKMKSNAAFLASSRVRSIENASKNQYEIDKWIDSVVDIRRSKNNASRPLLHDVQYKVASKMPSIDQIMIQSFPKELQDEFDIMMESLSREGGKSNTTSSNHDFSLGATSSSSLLLNPLIDLTVEEYAKIICALFDIPVVEGQIIQSLHFLFNLCIEYQKDPENTDAISVL